MLYLLTAQRGVGWQDSAMLQWRAWVGDYHGRLGLALAHPLYVAGAALAGRLTGKCFIYGMNAFTALGSAVALANLACLTAMLTRRQWIGLATAAMLGVAHTVWWLSTIVEAGYTWSIAGLTAELWLLACLLRRPRWQTLTGLAFVNGLGLCIHNFALLALPVYAVVAVAMVVRKRLAKWSLAAAAAAYLLGAGMYIGMTINQAVETGDLAAAISSALFGRGGRFASAVLGAGGNWKFFRENAAIGLLNFASLLLPLAVIGWVAMRRRVGGHLAAAIAAITAIHLIFVARYPVPDQFMFLLPALVMIALAAGVGASALAEKSRQWRIVAAVACAVSVAAPPAIYAAGPALIRAAGVSVVRASERPRDELRYWIVPWKHNEDSAERFAAAAMRQAQPDGVIITDSTSEFVLKIVQKSSGLAPDVSVEPNSTAEMLRGENLDIFRKSLGQRPLYLVSPIIAPKELKEKARLVKGNNEVLWRVQW